MSGTLRQRFNCAIPHIRWKVSALFWSRLGKRSAAAKERVLLRRLLRATPYWAEGHLRLGCAELALELFADTRRDPRAISAIRVSAAAVEQLAQGPEPEAQRLRHQAKYLRAMAQFLSQQFEEALCSLIEVLDPGQVDFVSEEVGLQAMEHAGAAAMALGQEAEAARWFSGIPPQKRSAETAAALDYLEKKGV